MLVEMTFVNEAGKPNTALESEIISVTPRKIACVPRVMINGCRPVTLISKPLIKPKNAPSKTPSRTAKIGFTPATMSWAVIIPVRATTEPTERSIPAIKMAKNSPIAIKILTELCAKICVTVEVEKKCCGRAIASAASKIIKIPNVPYFCQMILKVGFSFFSCLVAI